MIVESEIASVPEEETQSPVERLQREYAVKWLAAMLASAEERAQEKVADRLAAKKRWSELQIQTKAVIGEIRKLPGQDVEKILAEAAAKYKLESNVPDSGIIAEAERLLRETQDTQKVA